MRSSPNTFIVYIPETKAPLSDVMCKCLIFTADMKQIHGSAIQTVPNRKAVQIVHCQTAKIYL